MAEACRVRGLITRNKPGGAFLWKCIRTNATCFTSKRIHDEVYPEKHDRIEGRLELYTRKPNENV